jgi:hypothetical protein
MRTAAGPRAAACCRGVPRRVTHGAGTWRVWPGEHGTPVQGRRIHHERGGGLGKLGVALLIALGFEFVNGFHDTANAVATVIYTHSLPANSP